MPNDELKSPGWAPVRTLDDLDALNNGEIQEGYFDGREDAPLSPGLAATALALIGTAGASA